MQLLLSTIYQQAKNTQRNVELAIDEAHYLFEDQANLDFLETAFRHQRHAGLRMVLLSQTAQEFYETEQAEKIIGMCPIKVFHKLPELDDRTADKIGLTKEQRQYVRGADAGKADLGYSQALVRVEEHGTYPLHVVADEFEKRVIDYEPADQAFIQQAMNDESAELLAFEEFVETEAQQNALATRLDITAERASKLLEEDLSKTEVLDAVVEQALETETGSEEASIQTDGGASAPDQHPTDPECDN